MKIYMFPISNPDKSASRNPYIDNLIVSLEQNHCDVVNKDKINKFGVFDLLLYIGKVDVYYVNWIENLSDRKLGWIQGIMFFIIFLILKLFRKKIVWMMHNKVSHSKKSLFLKVITTYFLINYADYVFTHSLDGVRFGNTLMKKDKSISFMHHPIENNINKLDHKDKDIDILIWGSISPYKGIDRFLEVLHKKQAADKYNIYIVGKITDKKLEEKLNLLLNHKIVIENDFVSRERLEKLFSRSKIVLFTYAGYSTLASGALMDTLSYGKKIIGPDVGAFKDLSEEGLIETFTNFDTLIAKLKYTVSGNKEYINNLSEFIEKHQWNKFGNWLCTVIIGKSSDS